MGGTTPRQVGLGGIRKLDKQGTMGEQASKHIPPWSLLRFLLECLS